MGPEKGLMIWGCHPVFDAYEFPFSAGVPMHTFWVYPMGNPMNCAGTAKPTKQIKAGIVTTSAQGVGGRYKPPIEKVATPIRAFQN